MLEYSNGKVTIYLRKNIVHIDYYDVAAELGAFCFTKEANYTHDINDKLALPKETLRRKGIPVDRLLKGTQKEGQLIRSLNLIANNKILELFLASGMAPQQQEQQQKEQPREKSMFLQNIRKLVLIYVCLKLLIKVQKKSILLSNKVQSA